VGTGQHNGYVLNQLLPQILQKIISFALYLYNSFCGPEFISWIVYDFFIITFRILLGPFHLHVHQKLCFLKMKRA
jgi:hypothetical protein